MTTPLLNPTAATRLNTLNAVVQNKSIQQKLKAAFTQNKGNWTATLDTLKSQQISEADIRKLDFAHSLATITNDNPKLAATIAGLPKISNLRDFALANDKATIMSMLTDDVIPTDTPGATVSEQKQHYATTINNKIFAAAPSAVLQRMTANAELPIADANLRGGVVSFLSNQPDFNIRTTSVYAAIQNKNAFAGIAEDNRGAVVNQLKTLQRLQAISPAPEIVAGLMSANIDSAFQVADKTESSFLNAFGNTLGETETRAVYSNAVNVKLRNEQALRNFSEAVKGTGVAFIDGGDTPETRMIAFNEAIAKQGINLSWEALFGNVDLCECGDCTSVYSPAAYFVELLQYLRNNDLDPQNPHTGTKGIAGTPLEKLFNRRPDLGCLELTCANTNTLIPYIDLVNEVMESFVVHLDKFKVTETAAETGATDLIDPWNTEDETSSEQLAQPQHTNYKAYCILKNAVYPFTLPYHQPIDAIRIFLKFLGTSRYELLKTFRMAGLSDESPAGSDTADPNLPQLLVLNDTALDRAIGAEYLNITEEEFIILTKEAFWPKQYFDLKGDTTLTTADYQQKIGVKNVWEYYGYSNESDMASTDETAKTGLSFVKDQFLKRTGILYTDLIDLLLTRFINPHYPRGKALTILESIRFSYRFLQKLVDNSSTDPKVKYAKLIAFLESAQPLVALLNKFLHPDPCHAHRPDRSIDPKELEKWVYCHFEKTGKLIVLETGDGPYFPLEGDLYARKNYETEGQGMIGTLHSNGTITGQHNELIGTVDEQSKIVFTGNATAYSGEYLIIMDGPDRVGYTWQDEVFRYGQPSQDQIMYAKDERDEQVTWLPPQDTCDIDKVRLQHLDGTPLTTAEYDKFQRFIRLWRKLGWTIDETDKAVTALGCYQTGDASASGTAPAAANLFDAYSDSCDCDDGSDTGCDCGCGSAGGMKYYFDITPDLLQQLVYIKKLLDHTGMELIRLLVFWTNIGTLGNPSLYARLFLTHNMIGIDPIFKADANGNYLSGAEKISDHIPVIMAAFNLKAKDIATIMDVAGIPDALTLVNISAIYRHALIMRILSVKSYEVGPILELFGNPFTDAKTSYHFLTLWDRIEDAGSDYRQLNYIVNNADDPNKPLTPKRKQMLQLAKTLFDGLMQIDNDNADITNDEEATSDFVRAKAALLYDSDTTGNIMGLLEGSTLYTTNAPVNLVASQQDFTVKLTGDLVNRLKYDFTAGSIQVTGILTEAEKTAAMALFSDPGWGAAIERASKQPLYFYKDVLEGIFPVPQPGQPDPAKDTLLQGDTNLPSALQDPNHPVPDTAPIKRAYFIKAFLPYLRDQLEHKFLTDTLSGQANIDLTATDTLISNVLIDAATGTPVLETFRSIKNQTPAASPWAGYLIPTMDNTYTFAITTTGTILEATLQINGQKIAFHQQDDPNNVWLSDPQKLSTGSIYSLAIAGLSADLHELTWKTPITEKTALPDAVLFRDDAANAVQKAFIQLQKAALLVNAFDLDAGEITYLQAHGADFDGLDFNVIKLIHWKHLDGFIRFRNTLPATDTNLISFLTWVNQATDASQLSAQIASLTLWQQSDIDKLIGSDHFNLTLKDFKNERCLLKLQQALYVAGKISMDINLLFNWAIPTSKFWVCHAIAESVRITTKARYTEDNWEQVVAPLNDQLREDQRDALMAYLLVQPELIKWGVKDADSLFEFFLIDVQMDACMQTSRMKQAINSVQLFVQRCFLGLEEKYGVTNEVLDRNRWEWMQREVLWVANRKVFLYPENWIDENLRDDQTAFFGELQSELLQKDISTQTVEDALKNYLYKVDEVSNMEAIGLFIEMKTDNEGNETGDAAKVHVFSRTRNAPYTFYYRYYDVTKANWYPWEKMQVDIPSYDKEDPVSGLVTANGSFLVPVVWNNRLLVFFPQIMKKTQRPSNSGSVTAKTDGSGNTKVPTPAPTSYHEIKMAWSEYRNGKWTQKQVSKDAVATNPIDNKHDIANFKFVPIISPDAVMISVDDYLDSDGGFIGTFSFTGSQIMLHDSIVNTNEGIPINFFNKQNNTQLYSWQIDDGYRVEKDLYFDDQSSKTEINNFYMPTWLNFYNPYSHDLLGEINQGQLDQFFAYNLTITDTDDAFGGGNSAPGIPGTYDELRRPYAIYNWELFFHLPALLAESLSKSQSFENAMSWFHYIFNPLAKGSDSQRFWQFWPFRQSQAKNYLENLFSTLSPNTPDAANGQINEWRDHPFQPHIIARQRPSAYMKWIVMKYLDNLIAWGDYLFTQHTIESINQATQLYVLASHILGKRPEMIPPRGIIKPETYKSLQDKWDAFGNAMVEMELVFPFSNQIDSPVEKSSGSIGFANIYGFASSLYFCIPDNPNLINYWDVVEDRLYKIRHCENIEGVFSLPPLWDPPIDPALLVQAAAQGVSISSVLNDLSTPVPNYRFNYLMQKSLELCAELKSMSSTLLSVLEKKDAEALAHMRARHDNTINTLVMEIKKQQLDEATKTLDGLEQNRKGPAYRLQHYLKLIGQDLSSVPDEHTDFTEIADQIEAPIDDSGLKLIAFEKEEMDKANEAADSQKSIGTVEMLGSILNVIPNFSGNMEPFGVGASISFGGSNLGAAAQAVARGMQVNSNYTSYQSSDAQRKGGFLRQLQERVLQANNAGYEIKQIDKQILTQQTRIQIASQDINNQQQQIDNAAEVTDFLQNKYTNEDLYSWMRDQTKSSYYQLYTLAYGLAKKAEMVYRFERGLSDSGFIQFGYWNAGHDGLLAGEQLYVDIKQLEAAYQQDKGYDFEVTKNISLRQINPLALLQLRETGSCEFELPEILFDMDFPGHFMRKIKSVTLSVPCIAGPYTGINATLRLLRNKFRTTAMATGKADYPETADASDPRFSTVNVPVTAIAASHGQNDGGVFELNFKDERFLPFEGAGAVSSWRLELPAGFRQFDYHSITDVIMQMRYTSKDGGDKLKTAASQFLLTYINSVEQLSDQEGLFTVFDLSHDFPNEWYKAMQQPLPAGAVSRTLTLNNLADRLPVFTRGRKLTGVDVVMFTTAGLAAGLFSLNDGSGDNAFGSDPKVGDYNAFGIHGASLAINNWTLTINNTTTPLNELWAVVRYILK